MESSCSSRMLVGYVIVSCYLLTNTIGSCTDQALDDRVPEFQLSAIRFAFQVPVLLVVALIKKHSLSVPFELRGHLLLLVLSNIMFNIGYFGAMVDVPMSIVNGLLITVTLVTVGLYTRCIANKILSTVQITIILICVIGSLMTIRHQTGHVPDSVHAVNGTGAVTQNDDTRLTSASLIRGYVSTLIAGIGNGIMYGEIGLFLADMNATVMALYMAIGGTLLSLPLSIYLQEVVVVKTAKNISLVAVHCVATLGDVLTTNYGTQIVGGVIAALIHSLQIVVLLIIQYTVMEGMEFLTPTWGEVVGCVVVTIGAVLMSAIECIQLRNVDLS